MLYKDIESNYSKINTLRNAKLPIKMEIAIARNLSVMKPVVDEITNKRLQLLHEYATKKADGSLDFIVTDNGSISFNFPSQDAKHTFEEQMEDMLNLDENLSLVKITDEDLYRLDDNKYESITPADIISLEFMIDKPIES